MKLVSLLLDPRGVINRRAYWMGLGLEAIPPIAVFCLSLTGLPAAMFDAVEGDVMEQVSTLILTGVLATAPVISGALGPLLVSDSGATPPDVASIAVYILVVGSRLYVMAVLCLKRSRDAGLGAGPVIALGLATLTADVAAWAWLRSMPVTAEMGLAVPGVINVLVVTPLWVLVLAWLGLVRSASVRARQVKPAS
ncbi:hypothetical protein PMI01_03101 [Caulobacter sp. AP07]|uniref:hypothetical protein n=1 Tax=Caulobacter sp. AP07 TaxID=1144304 RepID=UPI000271F7B0|nr:hypothetical protein [Caulobacter sp. AP07]EJL30549.1 hypothetical protein PMI01_03101 [Caulobacter sp. AP07]